MKRKTLESYKKWLDDMRARKRNLSAYKCPHCVKTLHTLTPPRDVWDAVIQCPYCGKSSYYVVAADGRVTVYKQREGIQATRGNTQ